MQPWLDSVLFGVILDKEYLREGGRSYGNGADGAGREDERFWSEQVGLGSEGDWHGV